MQRLLILGADGEIGSGLFHHWRMHENFIVSGTTRRKKNENLNLHYFDLKNPDFRTIDFSQFDSLIFCAAITSIKDCEDDLQNCKEINCIQTIKTITKACKAGCFVIFLSSNAVFDGKKAFPRHDDDVCPDTYYGEMKVRVESEIMTNSKLHGCVLRLTKVLGPKSKLIRFWNSKADAKEVIPVFKNQKVSPISIEEVASAVILCATNKSKEIFQLGGEDEISFAQFAENYFRDDFSKYKKIKKIDSDCVGQVVRHNSLDTYLPTK